jgi:putative hemolysin
MNGTLANIGLVVVFVLIGSLFAAAEIALVSLRESQVRALSTRGKRGEAVARLAADPNRFLAAVQVGVTLAGFLSASFGGATLSGQLAPVLERLGVPPGAAQPLALVLVTIAISILSLVLGELAPKRLALQRAEGFALALGPSIDRIAKVTRPVIWLLSVLTNLVVRLAGGDPSAQREQMSDEELRELVNTHETLGEEERRIVEDVFEAGDRQIREVMIPRTEVDFLDASTPVFKAAREALHQPHSRYPVIRGSADDVIGFVHVRDLLDPEMIGRSVRVGELARQSLVLPWTRPILAALADMRREGLHLAIVADEYGGTAGIVTMEDLVEELIGDIKDEYDVDEAETTVHRGGDIEVDGLLNLDDFEDETGVELPEGPYETVAGFLMQQLGRLPEVGDHVDYEEHRIAVRELDGRRVGRVLVTAVPPAVVPDAEDPSGSSATDLDARRPRHPEGESPDRGDPALEQPVERPVARGATAAVPDGSREGAKRR